MEVDKLEYFNELQVIHDNINVFYEKDMIKVTCNPLVKAKVIPLCFWK